MEIGQYHQFLKFELHSLSAEIKTTAKFCYNDPCNLIEYYCLMIENLSFIGMGIYLAIQKIDNLKISEINCLTPLYSELERKLREVSDNFKIPLDTSPKYFLRSNEKTANDIANLYDKYFLRT